MSAAAASATTSDYSARGRAGPTAGAQGCTPLPVVRSRILAPAGARPWATVDEAVPMPATLDRFTLVSDFELRGDQVRAVPELVAGLERGDRTRCCSASPARARRSRWRRSIARVNRPTLVMVHNKTLAAQLYQEFRRFFPHNAVEYFVSYYDYYQPEAYVPATDTYIEKEATINDEIDRMRLSATRSLFERRDVIIVASVSLHLRPRLAGGLLRHDAAARARPARSSRDADPAQAGRDPVRAQRPRLRPRHVPRARRHRRGLSVVRGERRCASSCSATRSTSSRPSTR